MLCPARNVKRSSSRREIMQIRNVDLHKERKNVREGIDEVNIKSYVVFIILNLLKTKL